MNIDNQYKRAILYFLFLCGETVRSTAKKINNVYSEYSTNVKTAQNGFKKIIDKASSIDDEFCSGRHVHFNNDVLKSLVKSGPQLIVDQIAERVDSSHGAVFCHIKEIGKVSYFEKWVRHELSDANCQ